MPRFEIIGPITEIETIAFGNSIRVIADLRSRYGQGSSDCFIPIELTEEIEQALYASAPLG